MGRGGDKLYGARLVYSTLPTTYSQGVLDLVLFKCIGI